VVFHPCIDGGIALDSAIEAQEIGFHGWPTFPILVWVSFSLLSFEKVENPRCLGHPAFLQLYLN
jgi:hypothetical protein